MSAAAAAAAGLGAGLYAQPRIARTQAIPQQQYVDDDGDLFREAQAEFRQSTGYQQVTGPEMGRPVLKNTGPSIAELQQAREKSRAATKKYYTDPNISLMSYTGDALTPEQAAIMESQNIGVAHFSEGVSLAEQQATVRKWRQLGII